MEVIHLSNIPEDILRVVLEHLGNQDLRDVFQMSLVTRQMRSLCLSIILRTCCITVDDKADNLEAPILQNAIFWKYLR
jgi:hypothetical protein